MTDQTTVSGSDARRQDEQPQGHLADNDGQAVQVRSANDTAHLLSLLRAARSWVEQGGTISGYGFYRPENPHDFSPDPESCSDQEMQNHKAACEAWDRGDYKAEPGSGWLHSEDGQSSVHITRAPWGIGSYTDIADEAADLIAAIDCALATPGATT